MSEFSISKNLRTTPKVVAGLADNAYSERWLPGCLNVCPVRFPVDNLQRCADPRSLVTLTAGCDSALERLAIENAVQRPYYTYLPLAADGIHQDYTPGGHYDTAGVRREEAFGLTGMNYASPGCACQGGQFKPDAEEERYRHGLQRYHDKRRIGNVCSHSGNVY